MGDASNKAASEEYGTERSNSTKGIPFLHMAPLARLQRSTAARVIEGLLTTRDDFAVAHRHSTSTLDA